MGISEDIMAVAKAGQQAEEIKALREELSKINALLEAQLEYNEMLKRNIRNLEGRL